MNECIASIVRIVDGMIGIGVYFMRVLERRNTLEPRFCTSRSDSLGVGSMWRLNVFALEGDRGARVRISIAEVGRNKGSVRKRYDEEEK